MWSAIQFVSGWASLVAFALAIVAAILKARWARIESLVRLAPKDDRPGLVEKLLEQRFDVDTSKLTRQQQFDLAIEQIQARQHRFVVATRAVIAIAVVMAAVAVAAILRPGSGRGTDAPTPDPTATGESAANESPTPDPPSQSAVLQNVANALDIDRVSAVVAHNLPDGPTHVTMSATGSLGSASLPIHVILVASRGGAISGFFALGPGRPDATVNGDMLWMFIPDWYDRDDNSGSARVTLSPETGGEPTDLTLDARANCIVVDGFPSAKVVAKPASFYRLEYSDLADVPSPVLAIFKRYGQLTASVATNGETLANLDPTTRAVFVRLRVSAMPPLRGLARLIPVDIGLPGYGGEVQGMED
jgi:hypothetical protein